MKTRLIDVCVADDLSQFLANISFECKVSIMHKRVLLEHFPKSPQRLEERRQPNELLLEKKGEKKDNSYFCIN